MTGHVYLVDQAVELAKGGVESNRELLGPEDDWQPVLIGLTETEATVVGFPIMPNLKDTLVEVLATIAKQFGFKAMAVVTTVWYVKVAVDASSLTDEEREALEREHMNTPPSEHPNRVEAVLIQALDAEVMRFRVAEIERHPDAPPTLGEWKPLGEDNDEYGGRFPDALRDVLR
jgi:hypothetical protein